MKFLAITSAMPAGVVSNDDILAEFTRRVGASASPAEVAVMRQSLERALQHAGSSLRHHRADGEYAVDFGLQAARAALDAAGLAPDDIDLLLYVGVGRGFIEPATANLFQAALGCRQATCFDILDACASWLRAVDVARHYQRCGSARHVLILNCEFNFREYADWDVRTPAALETAWAAFTIGEAATATVLGPGDDDFHIRFRNAGEACHLCEIPLPNRDQFRLADRGAPARALRFHSDSANLTRQAVGLIVEQYLADPVFRGADHDVIFTHAASTRVAVAGIRSLGLDPERLHDVFPRFGNTVSASLPLAVADAVEQGRLRRGQRVLMLMGSAGVAAGLCTFTW
jgi:3-oxoacyl-[acyl-carrier-protein] synthase III